LLVTVTAARKVASIPFNPMKTLIPTVAAVLLSLFQSEAADKRPTERQAVNVFRAYDKNRDSVVTADEWLMMRHMSPNDRSSRANTERGRFKAAEPSGDAKINQQEFVRWYTQGRFSGARDSGGPSAESGAARRGSRDGEGAARTGPRDGEGGARPGARDGEGAMRRGARDGEGGVRSGPRDGEGGRRGAAEGEGRGSAEGGNLTLNVDAAGQLLANGRAMTAKQRAAYLRQFAANAGGRKIYIRASRGTSMASLQNLIRECQKAGIKNLYMAGNGR
jgi:hypothetical protein